MGDMSPYYASVCMCKTSAYLKPVLQFEGDFSEAYSLGVFDFVVEVSFGKYLK